MTSRRQLTWCVTILGLAAALVLLGTAWNAGRDRNARYLAGGHDDRPPTGRTYQAALKLGIGGDMPAALAAFERLAASRQGTSEGAWATFQAALAAREAGEPARAAGFEAALRRQYPTHPVTLRLGGASPAEPAPDAQRLTDCGPRSLLRLAVDAGLSPSLEEVTRLCGTDEQGTTLAGLSSAAHGLGLSAAAVQMDAWFMRRHQPTGVAWVDGDHFVAFLPHAQRGRVWLFDPNEGESRVEQAEDLIRRSHGIALLVGTDDRPLPEIPGAGEEREE
jgi:hypothetical protein